MDAALDNLGIDSDVFVVGPFTKEAADPGWIENELSRIGFTLQDIEVKVVLVTLADEELFRERILGRHSPLDDWKFRNWEVFRSSLGSRTVTWPLPEPNVALIDNSHPDVAVTAKLVEQFVYD